MPQLKSLRVQLISGFILVIIVLIFFLYYNNYYAMNVVRSQVAEAERNLLTAYVKDLDRDLGDVNNFLYGLALQDSDITLMGMKQDDYQRYFAGQRVLQKFRYQLSIMRQTEGFFVYSLQTGEIADSFKSPGLYPVADAMIKAETAKGAGSTGWTVIPFASKQYLIRIVNVSNVEYIGALVDVGTIASSLQLWNHPQNEGISIVTDQWTPLTPSAFSPADLQELGGQTAGLPYQSYRNPENGTPYLVVILPSKAADIQLLYAIPDAKLLRNLPYFQRLIYTIPLGTVILVIIYLALLQRVLFRPISRLLKGMHQLKRGDLQANISGSANVEFAAINDTFNEMVVEISRLKIGVYEEQIKARDAQFKHLQAQINPHFFQNSLNIVFSLAELREYQLVKKLVQHLVDYLRFITRNKREWITLDQEMTHIRNYLEIQALRFQHIFSYRIDGDERCLTCCIPPLIVQPLVENAMIHGFDIDRGEFHVCIAIVPDEVEPERYFRVVVEDNGRGIPAEKLAALNKMSFADDSGSHAENAERRVGIWNVQQRLKLKFGTAAHITFASGEDQGTTVRLRLPVRHSSEGEDE